MKIIFCVPGRSFSNNFLISWTKILKHCNENGIQAELSNGYAPIVQLARYICLRIDPQSDCDHCLNPFSPEIEYDYIMWIDSDMVFEPYHLQKLIDADKQVITGLYKVDKTNEFACCEKGSRDRINEDYLKNNKGIIEASFAGLGFMLIKKGVFESMKFPYFTLQNNTECISETLSFCDNLKTHNIKIYANLDVVVGHEKTIIF